MNEFCKVCGHQLSLHGIQENDLDGTEADLMHCVNPECSEQYRTRSYHVRSMSPIKRAARRAALARSLALHSAAALKR
jgi:hypothetical protein